MHTSPYDPRWIAHIAVLVVGLASFCVTSLAAFLYVVEHRELKMRRLSAWASHLPPLDALDRIAIRTLVAGFVFLSGGLLTGIYLAHRTWSGSWETQPKVIVSVIAWLWYLALLLLRYRWGFRGAKFFTLSTVGFGLLMLTLVAMSLWHTGE